MHLNASCAAVLSALLLCSVPVFAESFSSSVTLDLRTLTFSGIPISISQIIPESVIEPSFVGTLPSQTQSTVLQHADPNNHPLLQHDIFSPTWVNGKVTDQQPAVGKAMSLLSTNRLSSSLLLLTSGLAGSQTVRDALVTATQAGSLTVSVNYTLRHSEFMLNDPDFFSVGRAGLSVGKFGDPTQATQFADFLSGASNSAKVQRGTLSVTRFFSAGESTLFEVFTTTRATVPEPDMLWPTVIGVLAIAFFFERKRRRELWWS